MLEMFIVAPLSEPPSSSTTGAPTVEGPLQIEVDIKRGPTSTTTALEAMPAQITPVGMIYMSMTSIQTLAQRKAHTESQLTQLLQHIQSGVRQAIS